MQRYFLDTAVLALATGGDHPLRGVCRSLLERAAAAEVELHVSVEAVQELLFHRMRRGPRPAAVQVSRDVAAMCRTHAFDDAVLERALALVESTALGGRDAVHAATAQVAGFDAIITPDRDFDGIAGLRRIDPSDLGSQESR